MLGEHLAQFLAQDKEHSVKDYFYYRCCDAAAAAAADGVVVTANIFGPKKNSEIEICL